MATFIGLVNYSDQGIRSVKDAIGRAGAARKTLADMGGELREYFLTMGTYDFVIIFDAPNDRVAATFLLGLGQAGNVRTTTLKAFSEAEFHDIVADLP